MLKSRGNAIPRKYIGQALVPPRLPPKYVVNIVKDRCKGCAVCIQFCPRKTLEESPEFNAKGYHFPVVRSNASNGEHSCVNCGYCTAVCPDFAIFITNSEEEE